VTQALSAGVLVAARVESGGRWAFWTSVLMVLTFTQFWVMPLTGPDGDAEASSLIRMLYFPAYGAALLLAITRVRETARTALRVPLLWMLIVMVFVSALWSIDPSVTQRRGVAVLFTTLAGVVLAARYDWTELSEVLGAALAILVFACFFLALFVPSYGRMTQLFPGAWRGVWYEKNALGDHMSIACIVFAAAAILNPKRWWLWVVMEGLAMTLILLSTSKTSLVALLIGLAGLGFVILAKRGPALGVITTFMGVTALLALIGIVYFASDTVLGLLGKDATLTGRTRLWAAVLSQIHTRPWTGFGYGAVWNDKTIWGPLAWISKRAKFIATHAHNSWLEVWLGMGCIGLGLWALAFAEAWVRSLTTLYRSVGGYFAPPFLAVYSLMTLTESVAVVYNDFIWVMFVAVAAKLAAPSRSDDSPVLALRFAAPSP
jgi:O-antigen ligase